MQRPQQKCIRFRSREKEYYDLADDPYEIRSDPNSVDRSTRTYWDQRLVDLHRCKGAGCRTAENAPTLPGQILSTTP